MSWCKILRKGVMASPEKVQAPKEIALPRKKVT